MAENIELTGPQRALKRVFTDVMAVADENDVRMVLVSLLEDVKRKRRRDVTIEAPCARMEMRVE